MLKRQKTTVTLNKMIHHHKVKKDDDVSNTESKKDNDISNNESDDVSDNDDMETEEQQYNTHKYFFQITKFY